MNGGSLEKKEEKFALEKKEGINIKRRNYWKRASKDKGCESGKMSLCFSPATLSPKWVVLGKMVTQGALCLLTSYFVAFSTALSLFRSQGLLGSGCLCILPSLFPPPIPNPPHTPFKNCSGNRSISSDFTHTWLLVTCWTLSLGSFSE